jgi:ferrous iron transport protein A
MYRFLSDVPIGATAYVTELNIKGPLRSRLEALGLIKGTSVTKVGMSPMGDPSAYRVRGAVIALRRRDACSICVSGVNYDGK